MIYAKESPELAKQLLGEERYNSIASKAGVPGGLGHKYYEEWRVLPFGDPGRDKIEKESRKYYHTIRSKAAK